MIDIHSHMLPMVDDGSNSVKMSLRLLDEAYQSGTNKVVLTPHFARSRHYINPKGKIRPLFQDLCRIVKQNHIPIKMYLGTEYFYESKTLFQSHLPDIQRINDTQYLLTEFFPDCKENTILEAVHEMVSRGLIPVIAHPERYECIQIDPMLYHKIRRKGGLLQMNKGSLLGLHGSFAEEAAYELLANKAYSFVGSDAHHPVYRDSDMSEACRIVKRYGGEKYAKKIFEKNPEKMLRGIEIRKKVSNET